MRVSSNISPEVITLEHYHPKAGYVELRLRENIREASDAEMFVYDEYSFILKDKEGLREEVEANMSDWLMTGRAVEVNERASLVQDMKEALEILGVDTLRTDLVKQAKDIKASEVA